MHAGRSRPLRALDRELLERPAEFNPWLHAVVPSLGAIAILPPLWYRAHPLPAYPLRIANWVAIAWVMAGIGVTVFVARTQRQALVSAERIFVEDVEVAPAVPGAPGV